MVNLDVNKNNYELKGLLFSQYSWQNVFNYGIKSDLGITYMNFGDRSDSVLRSNHPNSFLSLKDINKIDKTDLDFIMSNKLMNPENEKSISKFIGNFHLSCAYLCDYLRAKGYALPFMGISVNKLIEFGWIKLI